MFTPSFFPISSLYCKCAGGSCVGNDLAREGLLVAAKVADPVAPGGSGGRNVPLYGWPGSDSYPLQKPCAANGTDCAGTGGAEYTIVARQNLCMYVCSGHFLFAFSGVFYGELVLTV